MKASLLKSMWLCSQYRRLNITDQQELVKRRLRDIVRHAKQKSPYYQRLYQGLGDTFSLTDLTPVTKPDLMMHFNDWVTDQEVKLADINEFMSDLDNIGRKYLGKYLVFTTSGSTGNPLVTLCSNTTNNIMGAINVGRAFARKSDLKAFFKRGGRTIGVFATGGFYLGNSSVRARLLSMPWKKRQMAVTSALLPIPKIVSELNAFQPAMLGGYPTILELLIDEQKSGRLNINPVMIMTGGEYLSNDLRRRLNNTFGCYVQTSYSCTEGGTIACECTEHHFHINTDWVIVEPVDKDNNPVPDGVQSDKILLTNLFNYTQPFIRYEITDRVVMHHEPCPCGNPLPWLTVDGRSDDIVRFVENGAEIRIAPLSLYATLKEVKELQRFQLIVHPSNIIELRLIPVETIDKYEAFGKAQQAVQAFLRTHGILSANIVLSEYEPKQHPKSGKFKHIINAE